MRFKPTIWLPIAVVLSVGNLIAVAFAARPGEPWWHATIHAGLAVAFGLWAQRLRQKLRRASLPAGETLDAIQGLEAEVGQLRQELSEAQERLDFAERLMAQRVEERREKMPG
ncbi:MAG: hypothetical protein ACT4PM_03570 [Gemmatimonadales bacterium]